MRAALVLISLALISLALPAVATAQSAEPFDDALYRRGVEVYLANHCGGCHRLAAAETAGFFGPNHEAMGLIAAARIEDTHYRGSAVDAAGYLRESILDPRAYLVPGFALTPHRMPAYTTLDPADIEALVHLLLHQPPPESVAPAGR